MLSEKEIRAICAAEVFEQGRWLSRNGKILQLRVREDAAGDTVSMQGMVEGNFGFYHTVRLTRNLHKQPSLLDASCSCYASTRGSGVCCHIAALLLADRWPETQEPIPEEQEPIPEEQEPIPEESEPIPEEPEPVPEERKPPVTPPAEAPEQKLRSMEILFGQTICPESVGQTGFWAPPEVFQPEPVFWYPNDTNKVFHTNTGIIGTMGTGKTQFTKSLITQLYRQQHNNYDGTPLGILIFDYKGDYNNSKADFAQAVHPRVIQPYKLPFNPLALPSGGSRKPLLPVHVANTFKDTLCRAFRLGPRQQATLLHCILQAYERMGIRADVPATWTRTAPTFDMVYDIYNRNEEIPKTDSLAAAMQKLSRDQFHIFEDNPSRTEPLLDLLRGVVVIDLHGYDPDVQSLVVAITLDQFYAQMQAAGSSRTSGSLRQLTRLILVDEADNFLHEDFPALKKILKEGREFGVGTILSTQSLSHFTAGEDDYSRYILTWAVHNVSDLKEADVAYIFKLRQKTGELQAVYNAIKHLDKHCSAVKIGNDPPVILRDRAFWELD